jgi:integrase/recombinase XerC
MERTVFIEKKDEFLQQLSIERNLSAHTIRAYTSDLNQFIAFWETVHPSEHNNLSIRQIIERYLMLLFYKKLHKSSIARKFSCFRSFELFLSKQGILLHLKLKRPHVEKKLPVYLTINEMFDLLDNIADDALPTQFPVRDKTILELLYATGIRCSELVHIRVCDLDVSQKTIRILGKGRRERLALFGEQALKMLTLYINTERKRIESPEEALFLNYKGEQLSSRSVQRIIHMFRAFLKIDRPITPHKIRHTFATHLLHEGTDLRTVQELLGHKSLSSTERYTHVTLHDLKKVCNTLHPIQGILKKNSDAL